MMIGRSRNTRRPRTARIAAALVLLAPLAAWAQDDLSLESTQSAAERDLQQALAELSRLRDEIAADKLPLTRELATLETELIELRGAFQEQSRLLDTRTLDLNNLQSEIDARQSEKTYLSGLFDEYVRNLETRLHVVELQRYRDELQSARLAPEAADHTPARVFEIQSGVIERSIDRLLDVVGGTSFAGTAIREDGLVEQVDFALLGPIALYATKDGTAAGLAEQRLGSLEPGMTSFDDPAMVAEARAVVQTGTGELPLDPTLGNANRIEATQDTVREHILKGGPVMVPILLLAATALLVALGKWVQLARVRQPSTQRVERILAAVRKGEFTAAREQADRLHGPSGEMLRAGLEHVCEPKELVEEVMFEKTLETRLRLQSFLSFVAIAAAAAPLLGLLGTVTGMINTFKLITVFGTGDAKTLSSGISEALITTEFGLIVAIPALLLHAYLSRKAKRVTDGMEKLAVSFLNRIPSATPLPSDTPEKFADRVLEIIRRKIGEDYRAAPAGAGAGGWPSLDPPGERPEH
ncbi:MAG TPA: MotA/TolQ/ExbB proton channel family protein [Candidatus Polarisedimenticolaceae bacterium]|nr:MotA/TolQ/ExbB proton channel family protein [Candidatus Polarisedimenticolaceae bacterium]